MINIKKNILILAPFKFIKIKDFENYKKDFNFHFKYKKEKLLKKNLKKKIDGIIVNPGATYKIDKNFINQYESLNVIVTPSTGVNHIDIDYCQLKKIKVYSLLNDRTTLNSITASAEFTFTLILMAMRNYKRLIKLGDLKKWRTNEDQFRGNELFSKKIGIVGYGRIGKKIHKYSTAFGCKCSFYDPYVKKNNKNIIKINNLKKLFSHNDIIVLSPYLNTKNFEMINMSILNCLKKNSFLINTSRGEIINEKDLIKFMKKRKDVIVNLDVIQNEQQKKQNSNLIKYSNQKNSNLMITPHIAGLTFESQTKAGRFALIKITKSLKK